MFSALSQFAEFVNNVLSHRNQQAQVSVVELSFRRAAIQFDAVVTSIVNYAYSHNVRKLILWFRVDNEVFQLPQRLFSSHTLKHLTLATHCVNGFGPKSAWDFPVLETMNLSNMRFGGDGNKSLNLFSKCVNLKDLTLHKCSMSRLDIFNVCAPLLTNLTITDPDFFPEVFNVIAPQLENFTASVTDSFSDVLQLSVDDLDSLEEVNLSMRPLSYKKERCGPGLLDLFHKLYGAKILILDKGFIEVLSACLYQFYDPCPFNNLKCLKQKHRTPRMPAKVRNYLLESSPTATFITDLPQVLRKRSRDKVDKGTMAKKVPKMTKKALSPCTDQLSHKDSPFNNLNCLNQKDSIPRMPSEVKNQLLESSPIPTFNMDIPQVPDKRSMQEAENGTLANTLEKEKQQTGTGDEEKRMWEAKLFKQDEVIAEQKALLEAMKLQHEKIMLEAKVHLQDEVIARHKAMLEATKLVHENGMLEEKMQMQDEVIAKQKAMLETMKLQNEKRMFEARIQRQDKIIAQQNAMLEEMKLQHEKIETEPGNIDS